MKQMLIEQKETVWSDDIAIHAPSVQSSINTTLSVRLCECVCVCMCVCVYEYICVCEYIIMYICVWVLNAHWKIWFFVFMIYRVTPHTSNHTHTRDRQSLMRERIHLRTPTVNVSAQGLKDNGTWDVWCMMCDVCMMYDVWCVIYDAWCMMMHVWCVMYDVWLVGFHLLLGNWLMDLPALLLCLEAELRDIITWRRYVCVHCDSSAAVCTDLVKESRCCVISSDIDTHTRSQRTQLREMCSCLLSLDLDCVSILISDRLKVLS